MEWSDTKSWFMDILKSLIVFSIIAVVTATIVDGYSEVSEAKRAKQLLHISQIASVAEGLETATSIYFSVAYDAYADTCLGGDRNALRKYQDDSFDNWRLQLRRSNRVVPILNSVVEEVLEEANKMNELLEACNESAFNDQRVSSRDKSYAIVTEMYRRHNDCWSRITSRSIIEAAMYRLSVSNNGNRLAECLEN